MKANLLCTLAGAAFLLAVSGPAAWAESTSHASTSQSNIYNHTLPVLIKVDAHGNITDMRPAFKLSPRYEQLVRKTLDAMITGPARDDAGQPKDSTCVIYLSRKVTPQPDGKYTLQFTYVTTQEVPNGQYIWRHVEGQRVALVSQNLSPWRRVFNAGYTGYPDISHSRTPPVHSSVPHQHQHR